MSLADGQSFHPFNQHVLLQSILVISNLSDPAPEQSQNLCHVQFTAREDKWFCWPRSSKRVFMVTLVVFTLVESNKHFFYWQVMRNPPPLCPVCWLQWIPLKKKSIESGIYSLLLTPSHPSSMFSFKMDRGLCEGLTRHCHVYNVAKIRVVCAPTYCVYRSKLLMSQWNYKNSASPTVPHQQIFIFISV